MDEVLLGEITWIFFYKNHASAEPLKLSCNKTVVSERNGMK